MRVVVTCNLQLVTCNFVTCNLADGAAEGVAVRVIAHARDEAHVDPRLILVPILKLILILTLIRIPILVLHISNNSNYYEAPLAVRGAVEVGAGRVGGA